MDTIDSTDDLNAIPTDFSLKDSRAFSGFSTNDIARSRDFYGDILGLDITEEPEPMHMLTLKLATGGSVLIYPKDNHQAASYTVLNFPVDNIDTAVTALKAKGVVFERYPDMDNMDDDIARGLSTGIGPDVAWFKDPTGNILAVMQLS